MDKVGENARRAAVLRGCETFGAHHLRPSYQVVLGADRCSAAVGLPALLSGVFAGAVVPP